MLNETTLQIFATIGALTGLVSFVLIIFDINPRLKNHEKFHDEIGDKFRAVNLQLFRLKNDTVTDASLRKINRFMIWARERIQRQSLSFRRVGERLEAHSYPVRIKLPEIAKPKKSFIDLLLEAIEESAKSFSKEHFNDILTERLMKRVNSIGILVFNTPESFKHPTSCKEIKAGNGFIAYKFSDKSLPEVIKEVLECGYKMHHISKIKFHHS